MAAAVRMLARTEGILLNLNFVERGRSGRLHAAEDLNPLAGQFQNRRAYSGGVKADAYTVY